MEDYEASKQVMVAADAWKLPFTMEVDKIPGFWVVTGWPDESVTLRLRIRYSINEDPIGVFFEIRMNVQDEFALVGQLDSSLYEITVETPTSFFEEEGGPQLCGRRSSEAWRDAGPLLAASLILEALSPTGMPSSRRVPVMRSTRRASSLYPIMRLQ